MCFTHILDRLKIERAARNTVDAANARRFFQGHLDSPEAGGRFFYVKSGKKSLMAKDAAVAEQWRDLLATDSDISSRWDAMLGEDCR